MINIDDKTRRLSQATIVVGYKQENKAESIEFEIPDYLKEYDKKICFKTKDGKVFSKLFDNTTSNIFTFTRTETQYGELDATIQFFKTENEDMIIYKTSMLHIIFNESIICEDEVQPDEPKIPILESLIEKVTDLNNTITENEETRNNNENTRISNENIRIANETQRDIYYTGIQNKVNNGEFNGATYLPNVDTEGNITWTNDKGLENPSSQNIRGPQGIQGPQGEAFKIKKTYSSIEAMQADFDNMEVGDYAMIVTSIELEDNAKLYSRTETEWVFITDFSGAQGIQGPQGIQGIQGVQGERGIGISKLEVKQGYLYVTLTDSTTQNAGLIITDEVKQWLVNEVTNNAQSDFNTYYDGKVTDFDNHVTVKINEFNTNATDKTNEYNQNAEELINKVEQVQAENEALKAENKLIKEQIPSANISGNSMHIEDSSNLELSVERISGGYYQASEENSPSPDYPSEIETVKDNVKINAINKNFINMQKKTTSWNGANVTVENNKIIFVGASDGSLGLSFSSYESKIKISKGNKITYSSKYVSGSYTSGNTYYNLELIYQDGTSTVIYMDRNIRTYKNDISNTITLEKDVVAYQISGSGYTITGLTNELVYEFQLEIGDSASEIVEQRSQTAIMPIQQEMLTGDYIKDVEHHEWGKIESYNGEIITTDYISTTGELTTGATVYYKLAEPIDLELTSEQKVVRNQKLYTYKNITNISLSDELASIDVEYKRDLETMFNNKIKQIPSSTSHTTET